jgi:hypothetical protein
MDLATKPCHSLVIGLSNLGRAARRPRHCGSQERVFPLAAGGVAFVSCSAPAGSEPVVNLIPAFDDFYQEQRGGFPVRVHESQVFAVEFLRWPRANAGAHRSGFSSARGRICRASQQVCADSKRGHKRYLEEKTSVGSEFHAALTGKPSGHAQTASRAIKTNTTISSRKFSLGIPRLCAQQPADRCASNVPFPPATTGKRGPTSG